MRGSATVPTTRLTNWGPAVAGEGAIEAEGDMVGDTVADVDLDWVAVRVVVRVGDRDPVNDAGAHIGANPAARSKSKHSSGSGGVVLVPRRLQCP